MMASPLPPLSVPVPFTLKGVEVTMKSSEMLDGLTTGPEASNLIVRDSIVSLL